MRYNVNVAEHENKKDSMEIFKEDEIMTPELSKTTSYIQ